MHCVTASCFTGKYMQRIYNGKVLHQRQIIQIFDCRRGITHREWHSGRYNKAAQKYLVCVKQIKNQNVAWMFETNVSGVSSKMSSSFEKSILSAIISNFKDFDIFPEAFFVSWARPSDVAEEQWMDIFKDLGILATPAVLCLDISGACHH